MSATKSKLILISLFIFCYSNLFAQEEVIAYKNGSLPIYHFEKFSKFLKPSNDTLYIINFWATWCAPCVKELPHFEEFQRNNSYQKIRVVLVSLDFIENLHKRVIPFLEREDYESLVLLLDEPKAHKWIPTVSEEWSGALPATVIVKGNEYRFYEQTFSYNELEQKVLEVLSTK